MHFNTKRFQVVLGLTGFWLGGDPLPRSGIHCGVVIKWSIGLWLIEIRRWTGRKREVGVGSRFNEAILDDKIYNLKTVSIFDY